MLTEDSAQRNVNSSLIHEASFIDGEVYCRRVYQVNQVSSSLNGITRFHLLVSHMTVFRSSHTLFPISLSNSERQYNVYLYIYIYIYIVESLACGGGRQFYVGLVPSLICVECHEGLIISTT